MKGNSGYARYFWCMDTVLDCVGCMFFSFWCFHWNNIFWRLDFILQSQCPAAKTLCWNDPHPHICWSSGLVWPHCGHHSFFPSRPIKGRLGEKGSASPLLCGSLLHFQARFPAQSPKWFIMDRIRPVLYVVLRALVGVGLHGNKGCEVGKSLSCVSQI